MVIKLKDLFEKSFDLVFNVMMGLAAWLYSCASNVFLRLRMRLPLSKVLQINIYNASATIMGQWVGDRA